MAVKVYTNIPAMGAVQTRNVAPLMVKPTVTCMWSGSVYLERTSHSLQPCNYVSILLTGKLKAAVPTTKVKRKLASASLLFYYFIEVSIHVLRYLLI
jgi:hypothetical protein